MNKLFFLLLIFCATALSAQPDRPPHGADGHSERMNPEQRAERFARIKAARQAFITEELKLTKEEVVAFFPVYWEYEQRMAKDKRSAHHPGRATAESRVTTEAEARTELLRRRTQRQQMLALSLEAEDEFLAILPATKVIQLHEVEREFRKKLWDRTRERRGN